jgi:hypothetical protein
LRKNFEPFSKKLGERGQNLDKLMDTLEAAQANPNGSNNIDLSKLDLGNVLGGMLEPFGATSGGSNSNSNLNSSESKRSRAELELERAENERITARFKYTVGMLTENQSMIQSAATADMDDEDAREAKEEAEMKNNPLLAARNSIEGLLNGRLLLCLDYLMAKVGGLVYNQKMGAKANTPVFPEVKQMLDALDQRLQEKPDDPEIANEIMKWAVANKEAFTNKDETLWTKPTHPALIALKTPRIWNLCKKQYDEDAKYTVADQLWMARPLRNLMRLAPIFSEARATPYLFAFQKLFFTMDLANTTRGRLTKNEMKSAIRTSMLRMMSRSTVLQMKAKTNMQDPSASFRSLITLLPKILTAVNDMRADQAGESVPSSSSSSSSFSPPVPGMEPLHYPGPSATPSASSATPSTSSPAPPK